MTLGIHLKTLTNSDLDRLGLPSALLGGREVMPPEVLDNDAKPSLDALADDAEPVELVRALRYELEQTLDLLDAALAALVRPQPLC